MACFRCGTCHKLMTPVQRDFCKDLGHEAPYDEEFD